MKRFILALSILSSLVTAVIPTSGGDNPTDAWEWSEILPND